MNSFLQNFIKNNLCKSRDEELETEILRDRDETFETETSKNGSRDASRDRDQVSRLHHWLQYR